MARNGVRTRIALITLFIIALLVLVGVALNIGLSADDVRRIEQTTFANELTGLGQTATARGR